MPKNTVYWTHFVQAGWQFCVAATDDGVVYVDSHPDYMPRLIDYVDSRLPGSMLERADGKLKAVAVQLSEYLRRERTEFDIPLAPIGTPFQRTVWQALCTIPYGATRSYSDIARQIRKPTAVRAVGGAIGANPLTILIPCHRVIGKDGSLTGFGGGLDMKRRLLELEGYLLPMQA